MKNLADLPVIFTVTIKMQVTVTRITQVRIQEALTIAIKSTTSVTTEEIHWGRVWEIICRRVSISLV